MDLSKIFQHPIIRFHLRLDCVVLMTVASNIFPSTWRNKTKTEKRDAMMIGIKELPAHELYEV